MRNLVLKEKAISGNQTVISDEYTNYHGNTVYKVFDNENGTKTVALAYMSNTPDLNENSSPFNDIKKEEASDTSFGNIISAERTNAALMSGTVRGSDRERAMQAWKIYHNYESGLIRSYVDFLTDITFDGFKHKANRTKKGSQEAKDWFDAWSKSVKARTVIHNAIHHMWIANNGFIWAMKGSSEKKYFSGLIPIPKKSKGVDGAHFSCAACIRNKDVFPTDDEYYVYDPNNNRTLTEPELFEYAAKKLKWSKQTIPVMLTNIWLPDCEISGGRYPGMRRYKVAIDQETIDFVKANKNFVRDNYPPAFMKIFDSKFSGHIILNEYDVYHVSMRRSDREYWGEPTWLAAVPDISRRQRRLQSDEKAVGKLIKQVVLVTIGDKDFPATEKQLMSAAALFRNPSSTFIAFWNHTMKVQFLGPDKLAEMLGSNTYEPIDASIAEALGFPLALLGRPGSSGGANFATMTKQIIPVVHKVKTARLALYEHVLDPLYAEIHEVMGFEKGAVSPVFNTNILEDPSQLVKRLMLYLTNRAIPFRDVVEFLPEEYEWEELLPQFKKEQPDIESGLYGTPPKLPLEGRPSDDPSPTSGFERKASPGGEGKTTDSNRNLGKAILEKEEELNCYKLPVSLMVNALVEAAKKEMSNTTDRI